MTNDGPSNEETAPVYAIDANRCIRCGVSMNLAPTIIRVGEKSAEVYRQPKSAEEIGLAEQARILCPVGAVRRSYRFSGRVADV